MVYLKTSITQEKLAHRFIAFVNHIIQTARCAIKSLLRLYTLSANATFNREKRHNPERVGALSAFSWALPDVLVWGGGVSG